MTGDRPGPDLLAVAERVLELLGEGQYVATYKYAVMLALLDLVLELPEGQDPTTHQLAEKIVQLYWPHTAPYGAREPSEVLRQNSRGQAEIVRDIARFRQEVVRDRSLPLVQARTRHRAAFDRLVREVELKLIEMPLARLQFIGDQEERFLYDIDWSRRDTEGRSWTQLRRRVRQYQTGEGGSFDNCIRLRPEARASLRQLNALLRPFVQARWTGMVAQFNSLEEARLHAFLFGVERIDLAPVRGPLRELQEDRCFYCGRRLARDVEVDHFLPWSRYPDNGLENLVVADGPCNGAKGDSLASMDHVGAWVDRFRADRAVTTALAHIAGRLTWERHPQRTLTVARFVYLELPRSARLWSESRHFDPPDGPALKRILLDPDLRPAE